MPIFEFECSKCGNRFEKLLFAGEEPECPRCSGKRVQKLVSSCVARTGSGGGSAGSTACGPCTATSCAGCRPAGGRR